MRSYTETKKENSNRNIYYWFKRATILSKLNNNKFLDAIEQGIILIDIDVTDKYNHGTIFRIKGKELTALYEEQTDLIPQRYNATLTN